MASDTAEDLVRAIQAHAVAKGDVDPDIEMLSDFVVVAHWQRIDNADTCNYTTHLRRDGTPTHVAVGLLRFGERLYLDDEEATP